MGRRKDETLDLVDFMESTGAVRDAYSEHDRLRRHPEPDYKRVQEMSRESKSFGVYTPKARGRRH